MKWLLLKDLQILRRSPLQLALLVLYPIAIALLVGFALTRGPEKQTVALYNAMPAGSSIGLGGEELNGNEIRGQLCSRVNCIDAHSNAEAKQLVENGDATAAVVLPADLGDKIRSLASLNPEQPTVDVIVNGSNTVENQVVDDQIDALLAEANQLIATRVSEGAGRYLDLILSGGNFSLLGQQIEVLGLQKSEKILIKVRAGTPPGKDRDDLDRAIRFAHLASDNLSLAGPLLKAISQPVAVDKSTVGDEAPSLNTFAIGVTATFALMFVTVLLVAGSLALEKEENAFTRLTGGLVTRTQILIAKIGLGTVIGLAVIFLLLAGLSLFVPVDWGRAPFWIIASLFGAAAFAAAGAALGAGAREVRAATLAAVMICLPVALLSLIPDDAVGPAMESIISIVTAAFPFKPSLDALTAGLDLTGPSMWLPMLHLAILTVVYGALARFALRKF